MDSTALIFEPKTIVVLDATAPDGEAALEALTDADRHITLITLLGHQSARSIREFAAAEQLIVAEAADVYLDQAAERVGAGSTRLVETVVSGASELMRAISEVTALDDVSRAIVPRSLVGANELRARIAFADLPVTLQLAGPRHTTTAPSKIRGRRGRRISGMVMTMPSMADLPADELIALDVLTTPVDIEVAERVIEQNATGRQCMFVVDGLLAVERNGSRIAELGPGECAGELALLTGEPCNADVVAATDATVLVMSRHEFATMLDECPTMAARVLRRAVTRLVA